MVLFRLFFSYVIRIKSVIWNCELTAASSRIACDDSRWVFHVFPAIEAAWNGIGSEIQLRISPRNNLATRDITITKCAWSFELSSATRWKIPAGEPWKRINPPPDFGVDFLRFLDRSDAIEAGNKQRDSLVTKVDVISSGFN